MPGILSGCGLLGSGCGRGESGKTKLGIFCPRRLRCGMNDLTSRKDRGKFLGPCWKIEGGVERGIKFRMEWNYH